MRQSCCLSALTWCLDGNGFKKSPQRRRGLIREKVVSVFGCDLFFAFCLADATQMLDKVHFFANACPACNLMCVLGCLTVWCWHMVRLLGRNGEFLTEYCAEYILKVIFMSGLDM